MVKDYRESNGRPWRVEPICAVLKAEYGVSISTSGYYAFKNRPMSARAKRDILLRERILQIHGENYSCYGIRKVWRLLLKDDHSVARCTVERLMREMKLCGIVRGKVKRTTIANKKTKSVEDLVKREFTASVPNKLWVADFTYISTWNGWCYTAFITDVFARKILGWSVSTCMSRKLAANAFRMAVYTRIREGHDDFKNLIHHSDKGSQYTAADFIKLLALHGVRVSTGSTGDAFDNALAETVHGLYKTELVKNKGPWKNAEQLKLETVRWVNWYNTQRISERNNWNSPTMVERMWYNNAVDARKSLT
jgi:putative transposase